MSDDLHRRNDHAPRYRPVRSPLMSMGPSLDEERRRHRAARMVAVASVVVVAAAVLLVWLVGMLGREVVAGAPEAGAAGGTRAAASATAAVEKTGAPTPQTLASAVVDKGESQLRLQLPIRREAITGIGFGPRREAGVIELEPSGTRANTSFIRRAMQRFLSTAPAGDLTWYQLADGTTAMVVVGALPDTEVYAPIDGTIEAITPYELDGEARGVLIQIQPTGDSQTTVVLRNIEVDADLQVGTSVTPSVTRLGTVRDMVGAIAAPLADFTHDSGSGVDMYALRVDGGAASRLG